MRYDLQFFYRVSGTRGSKWFIVKPDCTTRIVIYLPYTQAIHSISRKATTIKESPAQYQSITVNQYIPLWNKENGYWSATEQNWPRQLQLQFRIGLLELQLRIFFTSVTMGNASKNCNIHKPARNLTLLRRKMGNSSSKPFTTASIIPNYFRSDRNIDEKARNIETKF